MAKNNNAMWWGLGTLAVVVGGLAFVLSDDDDKSSDSTSGGSSGGASGDSTGDGAPPSLEQVASQLRAQYLSISGCAVSWKSGDASRSGLQSHVQDFFAPALARARESGATSLDGATAWVAQFLVPGCDQPPGPLKGIAIDAALAGHLPMGVQQVFDAAQVQPSVQFFLAIRAVLSALMTARGG